MLIDVSILPLAAQAPNPVSTLYGATTFGQLTNAVTTGLKQIFDVLVLDSGGTGQTIWLAIISPCKVIAGISFLAAMRPLFQADFAKLRQKSQEIIIIFVLVAMFANNGSLGRVFGVVNYAAIQSINLAFRESLETAGNITAQITQVSEDRDIAEALTQQYNACLALPKTDVNGAPNPALTQCEATLRQSMADASSTNPGLAGKIADALSKGDLIGMGTALIKGVGSFIGDAAMKIPQAIMEAWQGGVAMGVQVSFALSLVMLPIALAFAVAYPVPLMAWVTGIWTLGIFQWAMTILTGVFQIITSALGADVPMFLSQMLMSFIAPAIAAAMAGFGAFGIFKAMENAVQNVVGIATKAVGKI